MSKPTPKPLFSTKNLQRAILIVLAALIVSLVSFGGYYYWDRYVYLGDQSPLEIDIAHMEEAIRADPQNPDTRIALAQFLLSKELYQDALEQTSQVLSLYPEHQGALLLTGVIHSRLDQPQEVVEPLEKFVAQRKDGEMAGMDTTLEMAYYFLGESYVKLNQPMAAISSLEAAVNITPSDADALYQLGLAYQASGKPEEALQRYHQAVRYVPYFTEVYRGMIDSYTALNQPDYVAYARGMEALTLEDYQTAKTQLEQATQVLPDFAPAFLGLGLTYEQLGQLKAALTAVDRGLELNPNDVAARQARGRIEATLSTKQD